MRIGTVIALVVYPLALWLLSWMLGISGALFSVDVAADWSYLIHVLCRLVPAGESTLDTFVSANLSDGALAFWSLWFFLVILFLPARLAYRKWAWVRWTALFLAVSLLTTTFIAAWPDLKPHVPAIKSLLLHIPFV